jgi:hypothetical protein
MSNQLVKTTSNQSIQKYEAVFHLPDKACKELREIKTVQDALAVKTPSLARLRKEKGAEYVGGCLELWIVYLQEFLNLKTKMNERMILGLVEMVLDDFPQLTIADIKIIITRAKKGQYGELYESLSPHKVYKWFESYFNERCEEAERQFLSDHFYNKNEEIGWRGERMKNFLTEQEINVIKNSGKDRK